MKQGERGVLSLAVLEHRTYGGQGQREKKGQKGRYKEHPQTTEATQALATNPDIRKARIPVF